MAKNRMLTFYYSLRAKTITHQPGNAERQNKVIQIERSFPLSLSNHGNGDGLFVVIAAAGADDKVIYHSIRRHRENMHND